MEEMKDLILSRINHPYLKQYIQTPTIDEDKLLLIISMLDTHGLTKKEMEDFVVTTMLIDIALDTHERVSNSSKDLTEDNDLKPRQLTVLAGTYYSSLYYKILSDSSNLAMIRVLSEGIKEVNEHKIIYYHKDAVEIDKLMNSLMIIESALLAKVADYFHEMDWKDISTHFLMLKKLVMEKHQFLLGEHSNLFEALRELVFPDQLSGLSLEQKQYMIMICDKYVDYSRGMIETAFQKLPSVNDKIRIQWMNLLGRQIPIAKTYVEEG
jgi:heptaprenyl diphosphate synthase